jgi:adenylate kinase
LGFRAPAHHKQQEVHHREQSAAHAAELEKIRQHFDAFKAAALPAADLAGVPVAIPPARDEEPQVAEETNRRHTWG